MRATRRPFVALRGPLRGLERHESVRRRSPGFAELRCPDRPCRGGATVYRDRAFPGGVRSPRWVPVSRFARRPGRLRSLARPVARTVPDCPCFPAGRFPAYRGGGGFVQRHSRVALGRFPRVTRQSIRFAGRTPEVPGLFRRSRRLKTFRSPSGPLPRRGCRRRRTGRRGRHRGPQAVGPRCTPGSPRHTPGPSCGG